MDKKVTIDYVTRVEGQSAVDIWISKTGELRDVKLRVYEPPRFFEALMVGRRYNEIMELAARICGICPVSHEVTALRAVENALDFKVSDQTRDMRKLLALSAFISSHALSIYFLTLPDYLGYRDLVEAASKHGELLKRGLHLKKVGNDLTELIGGRSVHPVTAVVGRFTNILSREEARDMKLKLMNSKSDALETVNTLKNIEIPNFERKSEHVALTMPDEYAINEGFFTSTSGMRVNEKDYRQQILEKQVNHSTGKYSTVKSRSSYLVGPLARVNLNFDRLSKDAKEAAKDAGFRAPSFSPFQSPLARAIEIVHAIDECSEILDSIDYKEEEKSIDVKAGDGFAITEAPRGINYHNYTLDRGGVVTKADIVPPTCQNYSNIEEDLRGYIPHLLDKSEEEIAQGCEMLIRTYDPCISCSVHTIRIHEMK